MILMGPYQPGICCDSNCILLSFSCSDKDARRGLCTHANEAVLATMGELLVFTFLHQYSSRCVQSIPVHSV